MPIRVAILIVSGFGLIACGITSSVLNAKMVGQVNSQLQQGDHFSPAVWYYAKTKATTQTFSK